MCTGCLKIEEIKVGDRVNTYQLDDIYDTYILLSNTQLKEDGSTEGTVEFIGEVQNQEMLDVFNMCRARDGKKPMIYAHRQMEYGAYSL